MTSELYCSQPENQTDRQTAVKTGPAAPMAKQRTRGPWTNIQVQRSLAKGPYSISLPPSLFSSLLLCHSLPSLPSLPTRPLLTRFRGITHDLMKSHMLRCVYF